MRKEHKKIFNNCLEYYKDLEFDNAKSNVEKLKQQLNAVETKRINTTYKKAYRLAEAGEFLISDCDMIEFLLNHGYKNINNNNVFEKYCHIIAISIRNGLDQLNNEGGLSND